MLTGLARRTCYDKISDGLWEVKSGETAAGNGKAPVQIRLASLPADVQVRYWQRALTPATPTDEAPAVNLTEYPVGARNEAMRRLPIVLAAIEIMREARDVNARIHALAAQHQESRSTVYRWTTAYRDEGLAGLLPGWGKLKGRFTAIPDALAGVIRDEYLKPERPSVANVTVNLSKFCAAAGIPCPSSYTIARFISSIPKNIVLKARYGEQAYKVHGEPKIRRDYDSLAVGEEWVGDHRKLDLFVRMSDEDGAKIVRPWLTVWMDLRSRTIVGWHLDLVPSSSTIALALRAGILRYGLPQRLYTDNGKDYTCEYWGGRGSVSRNVGIDPDARTVLALLKIDVTRAQVYSPWSKAIESWFGHCLPDWERTLPGWCGRDNKDRPEKLARELKTGACLTLDEVRTRIAERLTWYHEREHSALNATPRSCWTGVEKRIPDARALDLILMKHRPAKVFQDGLRLFGRRYWHDALIECNGQTVELRYDPGNLNELVIFKERRFLCIAHFDTNCTHPLTEADARKITHRRKASRKFINNYEQHRAIAWHQDEAERQVANDRGGRVLTLQRGLTPQPAPGGTVLREPTALDLPAVAHQRLVAQESKPTASTGRRVVGETRPAGKTVRDELLED
jgi:putative transposase